ncbi:DUF2877 domain-containing protein [Vibrio sp. ES.051]|uniref:DUF2877 domain-containing protein n=1 Tax=Vibrio sp. ES.051 TaxID=1761909 RepID=UPI0015CF3EEC|nr:DUF2877 domain-containing protein [Vibrio sp. ES.051]
MNPRAMMINDETWFQSLLPNQIIEVGFKQDTHLQHGLHLLLPPQSVTLFSPYLSSEVAFPNQINKMVYEYLNKYQKEMGIYSILGQSKKLPISSSVSYYSPMLLDYFLPRMDDFIEALKIQSSSIDLTNFLGFGSGLTPSSDDLLVGLLSVLDSLRHPYFSILSSACLNSLDKTTDVSRAMLFSACDQQYSQEIVELYSAISNSGDIEGKIINLLKIGHTSGHDTLCGIFIGLKLFR